MNEFCDLGVDVLAGEEQSKGMEEILQDLEAVPVVVVFHEQRELLEQVGGDPLVEDLFLVDVVDVQADRVEICKHLGFLDLRQILLEGLVAAVHEPQQVGTLVEVEVPVYHQPRLRLTQDHVHELAQLRLLIVKRLVQFCHGHVVAFAHPVQIIDLVHLLLNLLLLVQQREKHVHFFLLKHNLFEGVVIVKLALQSVLFVQFCIIQILGIFCLIYIYSFD